jgi:hypothetical protein
MASTIQNAKEKLLHAIALAEHQLSKAKFTIKDKLHLLEPIMIMPYYGFGNQHYVYLKGRCWKMTKLKKTMRPTALQHLKNTINVTNRMKFRYPAKSLICWQEMEVATDEEGYFELEFRSDTGFDYAQAGNKVKLTLLESKTDMDQREAEGILFVPQVMQSLA